MEQLFFNYDRQRWDGNNMVRLEDFRNRFPKDYRAVFEDLATDMFCAELELQRGVIRRDRQKGIEAEPVDLNSRRYAYQVKYYEPTTDLKDRKDELIKSIRTARENNVTDLMVFINKELPDKDPKTGEEYKYIKEINSVAKGSLGEAPITLDWWTKSKILSSLNTEKFRFLKDIYFRSIDIESGDSEYPIEVFPICNVMHNGHIEYLPSLIAVTPFNYTLIAVSQKYKYVANLLNYESINSLVWKQYSLKEFRNIGQLPQNTGVVVCIYDTEMAWICEILERRRQIIPNVPLILNIQINELSTAERVSLEAKNFVEQWPALSNEIKNNREELKDYFIVQTKLHSMRPIEINPRDNSDLAGNEYWRVLISEKEYQEQLLLDMKNEHLLTQCKWIFSQLPLSDDRYFITERLHLVSDGALVENFDRLLFRTKRYKWERKQNV